MRVCVFVCVCVSLSACVCAHAHRYGSLVPSGHSRLKFPSVGPSVRLVVDWVQPLLGGWLAKWCTENAGYSGH